MSLNLHLEMEPDALADNGTVESCYKNATEFIPERWGEKSDLVRDKSVFVPFSVGKFTFNYAVDDSFLFSKVNYFRPILLRGKTACIDGITQCHRTDCHSV